MDDKNPLGLRVKVYVAGASRELLRVQKMMQLVKAHPYLKLTHDWVQDIMNAGTQDSELSPEECRHYALRDIAGVQDADVVLYLKPERPSTGAAFEFGAAWGISSQWSMEGAYTGHSRVLIVSGADSAHVSIFHALADYQFTDDVTAYEWIVNHATMLIEP